MQNSRTLTLQTLIEKEACEEQVRLFKKMFGDSVLVTEELCVKYAGKFNFVWASENLLSVEGQQAYKAIVRQAWEAYVAIERPAGEAYDAVTRSALEAYAAVTRSALEAYVAVNRSALEAYDVEQAKAFALAYINDGAE